MQFNLNRILPWVFVFSCLLYFLGSCRKSDSTVTPVTQNLTIEGRVTGPGGIPLRNVTVRAGSATLTTDINGSFRANSSNFSTDEIFVTAQLPGYFTGSRTIFPRPGSNHYVQIELLPRVEVATFQSTSGGSANTGRAIVNFQANSFVNADGSAYSGNVSVKAVYIDPESDDLAIQMPGDLRGIRNSGEMRGLRTFGMVNVELESSAGNKLQIKPGTTAEIRMDIPSGLSSSAPQTIPLWYFDESKGLWKEEGSALKTGNTYVGNVSHFTFWNVDDPYQYAKIHMKVVNPTQQPLAGLRVELTSTSDSTTTADYTDVNGFVDGFVPINTTLRRDIFNECGDLVSTSVIGPFTSETDLGMVTLTTLTNQVTISGTVTDCNNLPVANGYVIITMPGNTVYTSITNGTYSTTFTNCSGVSGSATITAIDQGSQQQSSAATVDITGLIITAANIQACGVSANEFITITVDSVTRTWTNTSLYFLYAVQDPMENSGFYDVYVGAFDSVNQAGPNIIMNRPSADSIAPINGGVISMDIYDPVAPPQMMGDYYSESYTQSPVFTEYGAVGQFISGNFSGRFIRSFAPNVDTVNVSVSFKIRRIPF